MLKGIDISNHQGPPSAYRNQQWYRDAEFVITQAIDPPAPYAGWDVGGYTASQLRAAEEDGKYVGVYVWLWNSFSTSAATKADIAARLALIPDDVPLSMRLWLDMEDTTQDHGPARRQDVLDALEVMDEWAGARGLPPTGVYSGDWYIRGYMDAWFPPDRVYWMADYSLDPEPSPTVLPMRPIHQYTSTPVDKNVMLESELVGTEAPPVPDIDYGWLDKKAEVVTAAGELMSVADQLLAEANRKAGPRKTVIRKLEMDVQERAARILA